MRNSAMQRDGDASVSRLTSHFSLRNAAWYVFAGGGTGGHLFPALAVVDALRGRGVPVEVSFYCTDRRIDRDILSQARVEAVVQPVRPFPVRPWSWPGFLRRWHRSKAMCRRAFAQRRPAAVIGAGGYASGPPVAAAMALGVPTFLLNPDAVPGRANRHFARRRKLTAVFAQWDVTRRHLPADAPVLVTGCPVRSGFRSAAGADRAAARRRFGLDPDRASLLITGASQGARTINEAMIQLAAPVAAAGWQVLHLTGPADHARVTEAYSRAGLPGAVLPFTDRMAEAMAAADLVISRAGASTLAEILAVGRPSILLPYPFHRDQHQRHNGAVLVEAGAAVMLDDLRDASANARQIEPVLVPLLRDGVRRAAMAQAAGALDRPDAAERVADQLLQDASRNPESHPDRR